MVVEELPISKADIVDLLKGLGERVTELNIDGHKVLHYRSDLPITFLAVFVALGAALEDRSIAGISHFIEHTVFKGSERFGVGEFAKRVNEVGGYINAYTSFDHTSYYVIAPSDAIEDLIDVVYEMVFNPVFPEDEVEREREVILEEIRSSDDDPISFAFKRLLEETFPNTNLGKPILGYFDTVKGISREQLVETWRRYYTPINTITVISDPREPEEIREKLSKKLAQVYNKVGLSGDLPSLRSYFKLIKGFGSIARVHGKEIQLRGDVNKVYYLKSFVGVDVLSELHAAQEILIDELSSGRSSKLYTRFKEELKLADSIELEEFRVGTMSILTLTAVTDEDKVGKLREELAAFFDDLGSTLTSQDFSKAKAMTMYDIVAGLESNESIGRFLAEFALLGNYRLAFDKLLRLVDVSYDALKGFKGFEGCVEVIYSNA